MTNAPNLCKRDLENLENSSNPNVGMRDILIPVWGYVQARFGW